MENKLDGRAPRAPFGFQLPGGAAAEFWVVRHGESSWNASGRYQGQTDVPLSPLGEQQVAALAQRLAGRQFAAVYSSDLERARVTAQELAAALDGAPPVQLEPGLREIQVGELAGLTSAEIARQFPEYLADLRRDPWSTCRPGGESMRDLFVRSRRVFDALRERHPGGRILVVTHGGLVRVAVGLALGEEAGRQVWSRLSVANASLTRVILADGHGTLLGFNDDAHLEGLLETRDSRGPAGPVT
ncbi:histidine phosphatase family protein [Deinococcus proteolyticus]|uniref:histidine phosphatase family protein n=1 Tax=Deinococcus proteolyticus TaxID=55148 RepID=UPI001FDEB2E6|nr:histidine phosphatase family protein [Deinococcus proteolyticus]